MKKNEVSVVGEMEFMLKENKMFDWGKDGLKKKRFLGLKSTFDCNF